MEDIEDFCQINFENYPDINQDELTTFDPAQDHKFL